MSSDRETARDVLFGVVDVMEAESRHWRAYAGKRLRPAQDREALARNFTLRRAKAMRAYFASIEENELRRRRERARGAKA